MPPSPTADLSRYMGVRRNLLVFLASGLRSDALEDEQCWPLRTPRIGDLAARGVRLVATSACPTDPGGVVSLLSGLHPRQHGLCRDGAPTGRLPSLAPAWLREAGYHVAGVGCIAPFADAFDHAVPVHTAADAEPAACAYLGQMRTKGYAAALAQQRRQRARCGPFEPDRLLIDPEDDVDGFIGREAARLVDAMPDDRPWALFVAFSGPGNDLPPPPLYADLVSTAHLRDGFAPADFRRLDAVADPVYPRSMLQRLEPAAVARIRADYLGRVGLIDFHVGRLTCAADARPDAARTWTLLASDRGHLLGEHGLIGRNAFLAGAIETPLIVAGPAGAPVPAEREPEGQASTVDVAPTLAALAGADAPPTVAGHSLLPLLTGAGVVEREGVLSEFNRRTMLETDRHKALFDSATADCLALFDLLDDPDERRPLDPAHLGRHGMDRLRAQLAAALLPLRAPEP